MDGAVLRHAIEVSERICIPALHELAETKGAPVPRRTEIGIVAPRALQYTEALFGTAHPAKVVAEIGANPLAGRIDLECPFKVLQRQIEFPPVQADISERGVADALIVGKLDGFLARLKARPRIPSYGEKSLAHSKSSNCARKLCGSA